MHGNTKKAARKSNLFHPNDWTALKRNARKNGEVNDVVEVRQEKVFESHNPLIDKFQSPPLTNPNLFIVCGGRKASTTRK